MPPDGSTAIMGRSQTATEDSRIPHSHPDDTMDSEPAIPSTPTSESDFEKGDTSASQSSPQLSRVEAKMQSQPEKLLKSSADSTMTQRKVASSPQDEKKEGEVDIMDIPATVDIVWRNVFLFVYLHVFSAYGLYLLFTGQVLWQTVIWTALIHTCGALGITAGAHRYWAHKSYKAKLPLKLLLVFMQTVSFQNSIHEWSRDHRVHHKYSETNADPHNAKRGFFFAHMGWLMCRKHPAVKEKGKQIDMSDLEAEPLIMFQKKYYTPLVLMTSFVMPTFVAWFFLGEKFLTAWCFASQLRYCFNLHCTWLVNSAAHLWGDHPYDKAINPAENKGVAIFAFGEGWHNYHHVFPWDYKTAELGRYRYNFTAAFIDFFAWIGWAYDLKTVSDKMVRDRVRRTGDGSWRHEKESATLTEVTDSLASSMGMSHGGPWGWGDESIPLADSQMTQNLYPLID
ncbi:Acyl-CoA Delta(11) desaturase [Orchesella cincta]|uniref:Acyl-CoA Delta(11) desaturase n=1 Tax=Orchesella cincta TaxID=48709 RepID=A0A1D2NF30_ORCCI|nr:Acyl-CoA Delta(11) desaturase [Orchesella cincta]